ncbi:MAG: hypothetical protein C5B49_00115 [Bdellovibrio sp.]|nr:MAG: hypothetical protein C5B49_00115 [Bdellovibrio sp.]
MLASLPALLSLIFCFAPRAGAIYGNYNSILIGDLSAGLGGAGTSITEDASAGAWYNPATLAVFEGQSFSASVGIYKKFATTFGPSENPVNSALRANQGFFQAVPSSTGSVVRYEETEWLKDWTLTLSILVPEYDTYTGTVKSTDNYNSKIDFTDQALWVGAAFSRKISADGFFGFTVYYTARSFNLTITERTYTDAANFQIFSEERTITQNSVVLLLGYLNRVTENWNWGISFRLPSLSVAGQGVFARTSIINGQNTPAPISYSNLLSRGHIPVRLSTGVSYRGAPDWLWSFDLSYYGAESYSDMESDDIAERIEHKPIVNFALGAEYKWNSWFKLRGGVFTNLSSYPDPDPAKVWAQGDHVDQLGFSANAALLRKNIEYTFGGYYTGGHGLSSQRVDGQNTVIAKSQNLFTMLVGTSYHF